MSYMSKKTAVALGLTLAVSLPAHAVDDLTVDGYAKSSSGSPVRVRVACVGFKQRC